jgi:hypothetical protein
LVCTRVGSNDSKTLIFIQNKSFNFVLEFGIGYQWEPSTVTIRVGDRVKVIYESGSIRTFLFNFIRVVPLIMNTMSLASTISNILRFPIYLYIIKTCLIFLFRHLVELGSTSFSCCRIWSAPDPR